jgi:DNA-binding CsgD family transcriptional regulator
MNMASGVFIVLDATVNSDTNSRAGMFIRNTSPNALSHSDPSIYYLRGPIAIARERKLNVIPQWLMEFPVSEGDFFHKAMEGADASLPLFRTYYWNPSEMLTGDYDDAMLLCVPIVSSDGTILGICGFEVNAFLFKTRYFPDTSVFSSLFTVLAPVSESGAMNAGRAMFSGSTAVKMEGTLSESGYKHGLSVFESGGVRYVGLSAPVRLYSKNTVHDTEYKIAVLVPEAELTYYAAQKSGGLTALLVVLLLCAVGAALFLSRRYLAPVLKGLEQIKQRGADEFTPIGIPEIDDLLEFLAEQDETQKAELSQMERKLIRLGAEAEEESYILPTREAYEEFLRNLETLTKTEREVFDCYMEGHRAKDMPKLLYRSMNTIKMHNRNIYGKLCVSSREELMGYMKMMKDNEGVPKNEPKRTE